jgi:hypothetical protein
VYVCPYLFVCSCVHIYTLVSILMCLCMHVCPYLFVSTYAHIYTLVYILMCLSVYVCPYLFVCSCVHIYTLVSILMCLSVYVCPYLFVSTYAHIYTLVYILMCLSVYVCPYLFVCSCVHIYTLVSILMCLCMYVCSYVCPAQHICYLFDMFICYGSAGSYVICPTCSYVTCHMFISYVSTCSFRTPVHMFTSLQAHMFIRARVPTVYVHTYITGHMATYTLDHSMFTRSLVHTRSTHMLACSLVYSPMRSYGRYT